MTNAQQILRGPVEGRAFVTPRLLSLRVQFSRGTGHSLLREPADVPPHRPFPFALGVGVARVPGPLRHQDHHPPAMVSLQVNRLTKRGFWSKHERQPRRSTVLLSRGSLRGRGGVRRFRIESAYASIRSQDLPLRARAMRWGCRSSSQYKIPRRGIGHHNNVRRGHAWGPVGALPSRK